MITGSGGKIGRVLRAGLESDFEIRGVDVRRAAGVDVVADLSRGPLGDLFAGAEAVVDLAADPRVEATWERVRDNNVAVTVNVLEAARTAGVGRVIYASSNHVVGMYERDEPYASIVAGRCEGLDPASVRRLRDDDPIRPDSFYGVGKATGEAACRFYADTHGLSAICLRIGHVNLGDRPSNPSQFATLLTHRDLVQLVRRCLAAPPELRFGIFFGVSANTWRIWDIEAAREALGYTPQDDAERFR